MVVGKQKKKTVIFTLQLKFFNTSNEKLDWQMFEIEMQLRAFSESHVVYTNGI